MYCNRVVSPPGARPRRKHEEHKCYQYYKREGNSKKMTLMHADIVYSTVLRLYSVAVEGEPVHYFFPVRLQRP